MNIIPAIDLRDRQCVRLYQGNFDRQTKYAKDPVALALEYEKIGFDTLHLVDLDGALSGRQQNRKIMRQIVTESELITQLGGGIRTGSQIESWFNAGLARVVIGSLAVREPELVRGWLTTFGAEKIVLALDVNVDSTGLPNLATNGWCQAEEMTLWQCLDEYRSTDVKHVLCTDINRDGALSGPNLDLYSELVARYPEIKLQASGGVRSIADLNALRKIGATAAISGRALLDGKISKSEVATFLPAA